MPQEFHVVRCYKCEAFQVHIVKKVPKWECKICGEKQSVKKEYGRGTGKDCRLHVQKLNSLRAEIIPNDDSIADFPDESEYSKRIEIIEPDISKPPITSKWSIFLEENEVINDHTESCENLTNPRKRHTETCENLTNLSKKRRFTKVFNENEQCGSLGQTKFSHEQFSNNFNIENQSKSLENSANISPHFGKKSQKSIGNDDTYNNLETFAELSNIFPTSSNTITPNYLEKVPEKIYVKQFADDFKIENEIKSIQNVEKSHLEVLVSHKAIEDIDSLKNLTTSISVKEKISNNLQSSAKKFLDQINQKRGRNVFESPIDEHELNDLFSVDF